MPCAPVSPRMPLASSRAVRVFLVLVTNDLVTLRLLLGPEHGLGRARAKIIKGL